MVQSFREPTPAQSSTSCATAAAAALAPDWRIYARRRSTTSQTSPQVIFKFAVSKGWLVAIDWLSPSFEGAAISLHLGERDPGNCLRIVSSREIAPRQRLAIEFAAIEMVVGAVVEADRAVAIGAHVAIACSFQRLF
jgi:hypothetical protein